MRSADEHKGQKAVNGLSEIDQHFPEEATLYLPRKVFEQVKNMLKGAKYRRRLQLWDVLWQWQKDFQPHLRAPLLTVACDNDSAVNSLSIKPTNRTELRTYLRFRGEHYPRGQRTGRTPDRIFDDIACAEVVGILMEWKKLSLSEAVKMLVTEMCKQYTKYKPRSLKTQIFRSVQWVITKAKSLETERHRL